MKWILPLALLSLLTLSSTNAQTTELGRAFLLNEISETQRDQMATQYSRTLLETDNNDLQVAFGHWLAMLQSADEYARQINYDINGVKVWLHVYWNAQGGIDHIGFLLRPESRAVPTDELKAFFNGFARNYRIGTQGERPFSHYSMATFPTFAQPMGSR